MNKTKCLINTCAGFAARRGWCIKHYKRWKRNGDPNIVLRDMTKNLKCSIALCDRPVVSRGWCEMHYSRFKRHGDPNKVNSAGRKESGNTKKAIKSPTLLDIAWAAGFCEGEASFGFYGPKERGSERVSIAQVNKEPLQKMLDLFGGNISFSSRQKDRDLGIKNNDIFQWYLNGARARGFMMTVYSFMSLKRRNQIKKALRYIIHKTIL